MKFQKGNPGKPKGAKNKVTQRIRESFAKLIDDNLDGLQEDLDKLDPKDRLRTIIDLSGYILPKLKAIEVNETERKLPELALQLLNIPEDEFNV